MITVFTDYLCLLSALAACLMCSSLDPQHPPKILKLGRALLSLTYDCANSEGSPASSSVAASNSAWLFLMGRSFHER